MTTRVYVVFGRIAKRLGTVAARSAMVALLTALLFAQFSATTHELTVQHAICPQHGDVIDVDGRNTNSDSESASEADTYFAAAGDKPLTGHHQHCLFVSSRGQRNLVRFTKPQSIQLADVSHAVAPVRHEIRYVIGAIYLAAPKHSPPFA
jgi:hypothetical protein